MSKNKIRVIELFAGVGGFRIGLDRASNGRAVKFETVWSNQWEPGTKNQAASLVYRARFGDVGHVNDDISTVDIKEIPEHDMLVGGFPCQDYSVARTLNQAHGIVGKKGVLWWQIHRLLDENREKPRYLFLENVDRLLKSPANQRGRDYAIMLASLSDLGYGVEWRVINAADYGMPQRRRRVYILGYHKTTDIYKALEKARRNKEQKAWLFDKGILAQAFPVQKNLYKDTHSFTLDGDLPAISNEFNSGPSKSSPFSSSGLMMEREVYSTQTYPYYEGPYTLLGDVLIDDKDVPESYYIDASAMENWTYLKGAKNEMRGNSKNGFTYKYSEGPISFPDPLDKPSRTIITSEGGSAPSRFKHVIATKDGRMRRLVPLELERLNMFPDEHTKLDGVSDVKRAFFMGNALVVGVIERTGKMLLNYV